jgi:hypothetical protein
VNSFFNRLFQLLGITAFIVSIYLTVLITSPQFNELKEVNEKPGVVVGLIISWILWPLIFFVQWLGCRGEISRSNRNAIQPDEKYVFFYKVSMILMSFL